MRANAFAGFGFPRFLCFATWVLAIFTVVHHVAPSLSAKQSNRRVVGSQQAEPITSALDINEVRFVGEVLSGTEYSAVDDRVSIRWATKPKLSNFGPNEHSTIVKNVLRQLNEVLPSANQIELLEPKDENATLKVYFTPLKSFPDIAKENGFPNVEQNHGFFQVRWNAKREIVSAVVLIADDKMSANRLHHFALEEITQAMGPGGDSSRFEKSVFFENQNKRRFGTARTLSKLDKKTIRFLYSHVPPGSHPIEIGVLMAKHWNEMDR